MIMNVTQMTRSARAKSYKTYLLCCHLYLSIFWIASVLKMSVASVLPSSLWNSILSVLPGVRLMSIIIVLYCTGQS